jgi:hypothetical protein
MGLAEIVGHEVVFQNVDGLAGGPARHGLDEAAASTGPMIIAVPFISLKSSSTVNDGPLVPSF